VASRGPAFVTRDSRSVRYCRSGYDVVVGSRFSRHSVLLNYPWLKIVTNRGFHVLAQIVLLRRFRDLTNNLKLIRREVIEKLQLREPGFAVNAETGLQPLLMGHTINQRDSHLLDQSNPGHGHVVVPTVTCGWRILRTCCGIFGSSAFSAQEGIVPRASAQRGIPTGATMLCLRKTGPGSLRR